MITSTGYGSFNVEHPLDWWAAGGLEEVCAQYASLEPERDWSYPHAKRRAYKRVHGALNKMFKATGNKVWKPVGHKEHERLRLKIRTFKIWDYDLV